MIADKERCPLAGSRASYLLSKVSFSDVGDREQVAGKTYLICSRAVTTWLREKGEKNVDLNEEGKTNEILR